MNHCLSIPLLLFATMSGFHSLAVGQEARLAAGSVDVVGEEDAQQEGWQVLFDGRTLNGWRANADPDAFSVVNGTIRAQGQGKKLSHLFYVGSGKERFVKFKDFEFELYARSEPNSNSGIFIHTDMSLRPPRRYLNTGYEVQLNSSKKEKKKTGSLYAVVNLKKSPVDETKWFRVNVRVKGKRIMIAVNGKQLVDYTEPEDPVREPSRKGRVLKPEGGGIALQAHDPKSVFYFKGIRLRELE